MKAGVVFGTVALTVVLVGSAWAGEQNHTCQGGHNCNTGSSTPITTTTNINVSAAQAKAAAEAQAQAGAAALANQSYEGSFTGSYTGSQSASQTLNVEGTKFDRYAPPAYAPGLTSAGTGVCLGSVSIGASGPMAGLSFGITKVDKGCERRSGAALLYQMGFREAALRLLMNDDEISEALGFRRTSSAPATTVAPSTVYQGN